MLRGYFVVEAILSRGYFVLVAILYEAILSEAILYEAILSEAILYKILLNDIGRILGVYSLNNMILW